MLEISVTVLTKNASKSLRDTLELLKDFSDVIVLDNGSTDNTLAIAENYPNVRIFKHSFIGFGPLHNLASSYALYDWIFSIDSDEVLSQNLFEEIRTLHLDENFVYSFPRKNFYKGQHIKGCGWGTNHVVRLFNRKIFSFSQDQVHEKVVASRMSIIYLQNPLLHTPYHSISEFLHKMQLYSDLFAEQSNQKSSPSKALAHAFMAFFKSYILKKGLFDGYAGFLISAYNGHTAFYKYLKLYEKNAC
ncbi:MAG: glycosyltransferase family 2 protein [Chlamydiae bacterium]|nr:glycosyltransferase family 2 protein [Chlamydiota bacterium]